MYVKLKKQFVLRGWDKLPYSIQNIENGNTTFLDDVSFQSLLFCNGQIDVNSPFLLSKHRELISKFLEHNVIEECSYGDEIQEYQKYKLANCRYIKRAHWSITGKCNLHCRHCYMSAPQSKYGELSTKQCLDIVDQIANANISNVSLTGGEPLVRKDFFEIVDALINRHIYISQIYTNGVLVNESLIQELEKRNIRPEFSLSFDGVGCHDWMRGVNGTEEITIDAIKLLKSHGFEVAIETALYSGNLDSLEKTMNLFINLNVDRWKTSPTCDTGNWLNENGQYTPSVSQIYEAYLNFIPKYRMGNSPLNIMLSGFFSCQKNTNNYSIPLKKFDGTENCLTLSTCLSMRNTMYISANGKVLPCISMAGSDLQLDMPNILDIGLNRILSSSKYMSLIDTRVNDIINKNEKCQICENRLLCAGGCRSAALSYCNDFYGIDQYSCYFFEKDYEQRIKEIYSL